MQLILLQGRLELDLNVNEQTLRDEVYRYHCTWLLPYLPTLADLKHWLTTRYPILCVNINHLELDLRDLCVSSQYLRRMPCGARSVDQQIPIGASWKALQIGYLEINFESYLRLLDETHDYSVQLVSRWTLSKILDYLQNYVNLAPWSDPISATTALCLLINV